MTYLPLIKPVSALFGLNFCLSPAITKRYPSYTPSFLGCFVSPPGGTAKSTAVRAFTQMMYNRLPVTLPINATEDRVVGGWRIDELMKSKPVEQPGLLEEADKGLLYIDEINLLDDHIVNIILDVTSTGVLVVQREGKSRQEQVSFTLVGTMNPEEGELRPQLLDRFGLRVSVKSEIDINLRTSILENVLKFDEAVSIHTEENPSSYIQEYLQKDEKFKDKLVKAKDKLYQVKIPLEIVSECIQLATDSKAQGNRADYIIALASRAYAVRKSTDDDQEVIVTSEDVTAVAELVLQHRRLEAVI
ncbi:AAA family ATPase [Fortiea contorta]|uniref:AAA family ATPase n=1 Tax=Fortiea contorta TaxID=1892405 RepID=UPI0023795EF1|nr:AAA family ATPase [Fortiea contorta]